MVASFTLCLCLLGADFVQAPEPQTSSPGRLPFAAANPTMTTSFKADNNGVTLEIHVSDGTQLCPAIWCCYDAMLERRKCENVLCFSFCCCLFVFFFTRHFSFSPSLLFSAFLLSPPLSCSSLLSFSLTSLINAHHIHLGLFCRL